VLKPRLGSTHLYSRELGNHRKTWQWDYIASCAKISIVYSIAILERNRHLVYILLPA
jgi:hypothetical protein